MKKILNFFRLAKKQEKGLTLRERYPDKVFELIFTDIEGNKFYTLVNNSQMSYARSIVGEVAVRQAQFCLTKDDLLTLISEMKSYGNSGDIVNLFSLLTEVEERIQLAGEEETLLTLASSFVYMENEDIDMYHAGFQSEKIALWKKHERSRAFFLSMGYLSLTNSKTISDSDMLQYLKVITENQSLISTILAKPSIVLSTT